MIAQLFGWTGAALLIGAYGALTTGRCSSSDRYFHLANLAGGILLGVGGAMLGAWFSVGLNVFWAVVAVAGLRKKPNVL